MAPTRRSLPAGLLVLTVACGSSGSQPPDIFLLSVDTLRADHLGLYGGPAITPWIDELGARGVVFERATASSSWTVPSLGSLHTGLMPHELALSDVPSRPLAGDAVNRVPSTALTLAERLEARGYATWAVTSNAHLVPEMGYAQGFQNYTNVGFAPAAGVLEALEPMLDDIRSHRGPKFVWVHLFDPHDPYTARDPWLREALGPRPDPADLAAATELGTLAMRELNARPDLVRGGPSLRLTRALYDAEIRAADEALSEVAHRLGIAQDDLVVFTADHGEEFRDHGALGHRVNLYEETLRVPLVVVQGGRFAPARVDERLSLLDVLPTLTELAGVPVGPGAGVSTRSLVPLLEGRTRGPGALVVAEMTRTDDAEFRAIYDGTHKLIIEGRSPGVAQLFDLATDPGETTDLAASLPGRVQMMRRAMEAQRRDAMPLRPEYVESTPDDETAAQLRAMGYLDDDE